MTQHTQEPWARVYAGDFKVIAKEPGTFQNVADMKAATPDRREADARRIVACINACANITTEQLELIADMPTRIDRLDAFATLAISAPADG